MNSIKWVFKLGLSAGGHKQLYFNQKCAKSFEIKKNSNEYKDRDPYK